MSAGVERRGPELRDQRTAAAARQSELEAQILRIAIGAAQSHAPPRCRRRGRGRDGNSGSQDSDRIFDFKTGPTIWNWRETRLFEFRGRGFASGSGFYFLKNAAVRLGTWRCSSLRISFLSDRGFTRLATPDLALTQRPAGNRDSTPARPEGRKFTVNRRTRKLNLVRDGRKSRRRDVERSRFSTASSCRSMCVLSHCFSGRRRGRRPGVAWFYRFQPISTKSRCLRHAPEQSDGEFTRKAGTRMRNLTLWKVPLPGHRIRAPVMGGPAYRKIRPGKPWSLDAATGANGRGSTKARVIARIIKPGGSNVRYKNARAERHAVRFNTLNGTAIANGTAMIANFGKPSRPTNPINVPQRSSGPGRKRCLGGWG